MNRHPFVCPWNEHVLRPSTRIIFSKDSCGLCACFYLARHLPQILPSIMCTPCASASIVVLIWTPLPLPSSSCSSTIVKCLQWDAAFDSHTKLILLKFKLLVLWSLSLNSELYYPSLLNKGSRFFFAPLCDWLGSSSFWRFVSVCIVVWRGEDQNKLRPRR